MSVAITYYRLPRSEREQATCDQADWERFRKDLQDAQAKSISAALALLSVASTGQEDGLSQFNAFLQQSRNPRQFELEKDWHTIAYMLTGSTAMSVEHREGDMLHNVIFGSIATPSTTGYGPVRYHSEELVPQLASALEGLDQVMVAQRLDSISMGKTDIYSAPESQAERDGVLEVLRHFVCFFREAASTREEVICFVV